MTESELREYNHILRWGSQDEIRAFQDRIRKSREYPETFSDYMYAMIKRSGRTKAMIAQRAGLDRDYMYKILNLNSGKRTNERDYIIAICIAADMSLAEIQHALNLYPFPILDDSDDRAAVIISALLYTPKIYDLNIMLERAGFEPLRTSPDMKKTTIGPVRSTISGVNNVSSGYGEEQKAPEPRRIHMDKISAIDVWTGNLGPRSVSAEMKFVDSDGQEKFAQINISDEVSSFSVSRISLHTYNPDDIEHSWTSDNCEECYDTYEAEDLYYEMFGEGKPEDEDEDGYIDNYTMLLRVSAQSQYYQMYLKLDAAIDEYLAEHHDEPVQDSGDSEQYDDSEMEPIYTVDKVWFLNDVMSYENFRKETVGKYVDIEEAVRKASELYEAGATEGECFKLHVLVSDMFDMPVWEDGVLRKEI